MHFSVRLWCVCYWLQRLLCDVVVVVVIALLVGYSTTHFNSL